MTASSASSATSTDASAAVVASAPTSTAAIHCLAVSSAFTFATFTDTTVMPPASTSAPAVNSASFFHGLGFLVAWASVSFVIVSFHRVSSSITIGSESVLGQASYVRKRVARFALFGHRCVICIRWPIRPDDLSRG
jgi:hypothetical protein